MEHADEVLDLLCSSPPDPKALAIAPDLVSQGWIWLHSIMPRTALHETDVLSASERLRQDGMVQTMAGTVDSMHCAVRVTGRGRAAWRRMKAQMLRAAQRKRVAAAKKQQQADNERRKRCEAKIRQVAEYEVAKRSVVVPPPAREVPDSAASPASQHVSTETDGHREGVVDREAQLKRIMERELWHEDDLAVYFDVKVDTIRHMKSRGEIPGVVNLNNRQWRVHRDAFFAHFRQKGMPSRPKGRPRGAMNGPS